MSASASNLPSPPSGDYLAWIMNHPDEFGAYLNCVYALSNLEFAVTVNGVLRKYPVVFSGQNASVQINLDAG